MNNHIIFFSGGKASFAVADFVKTKYPDDNVLLYFTDTRYEHIDLYRFINEATDKLELPMLTHSAGLNPLELMFEKKLVFNNRIGDCSKILKMKVAADYLKKGIKPPIEKWRNRQFLKNEDFITNATLYFGIGFMELHREEKIKMNWEKPQKSGNSFKVEMPLINHNIYIDEVLQKHNLEQPELYNLGFAHNNCAAKCVKAGMGHFSNLMEKMPDEFEKTLEQEHYLKICVSSYRYIMEMESDGRDGFDEEVRQFLYEELDDAFRDYFYGRAEKPKLYIHPSASATVEHMKIKQYAYMKKNGQPYPIRQLKMDIKKSEEEKAKLGIQIDLFDISGCGCFVDFN